MNDAFALVLAMLGIGMLLARLRVFPENAAEVLNAVVLYVCLPASVLLYAPRLAFEPALLSLMALPWLLTAASAGMVWLLSRLVRLRRDEFAVLLLCVALGNTSFLGYPLTRALLGEAALPYAVVYDQLGTFLVLSTWGLWLLARYGGDAPPGPRTVLLRMLRFPPLWALAFGLVLMPAEPPSWIAGGLERLAQAMLPLVMLAIGLTLQLRLPRAELAALGGGLVLKLVALPALALGLGMALGMRGIVLQAGVLESAMPPMITAAALAISHRLAPRLAAAMVGFGTLIALATLPLWAWALRAFA
ncbi:AEC family transporter [Coralloluteibacterium thermophilus]|uniref:AEC family transporter n=1 Tax=Coralloluteibacterium thermophilum TaxID=2707049 RepID=A0ABV9NHH3_9GAMM